jgi:hypothetical protein
VIVCSVITTALQALSQIFVGRWYADTWSGVSWRCVTVVKPGEDDYRYCSRRSDAPAHSWLKWDYNSSTARGGAQQVTQLHCYICTAHFCRSARL